jgi:putative addiction module killer protein
MVDVRKTPEFDEWLNELQDVEGRARILARIRRLGLGNAGDVAPVGSGVSEMRIHYGPGYRVYFIQSGKVLVLLLCGGDKSTQDKDIKEAKKLAKYLK